jgi:hypothetical protein
VSGEREEDRKEEEESGGAMGVRHHGWVLFYLFPWAERRGCGELIRVDCG